MSRELLDPESLARDPRFRPFRPGVDILVLYGEPGAGPTSAILRYAPGAGIPAHRHSGFEQIYVLAGEQSDEHGTYPAGSLIVNRPGTIHSVKSGPGCLVLITWHEPVQFL